MGTNNQSNTGKHIIELNIPECISVDVLETNNLSISKTDNEKFVVIRDRKTRSQTIFKKQDLVNLALLALEFSQREKTEQKATKISITFDYK